VVPNGYHRLDLAPYKARYPKLKVLAAPQSEKRIAEVVPVDGSFEVLPSDPALRVVPFGGSKIGEAAFTVGQNVIIPGDSLFNHRHPKGFGGFLFRLSGSTGGPRVTPLMRLVGVSDKKLLAGTFRELAALPGLKRVIVSHGDHVDKDPAGVLNAIADKLEGKTSAWPKYSFA
jgi:hypothetical protein